MFQDYSLNDDVTFNEFAAQRGGGGTDGGELNTCSSLLFRATYCVFKSIVSIEMEN